MLNAYFCSLLGRSSDKGDSIFCDNAEIVLILGVMRSNFSKNMVLLYPHFRGLETAGIV